MVRIGLSSASMHLKDALGRPWYELDPDSRHAGGRQVVGTTALPPALDLLDVPAELSTHGVHTLDLCIQHIANIDRNYLKDLRSAFEESNVELYQLLIDLGNVSSVDSTERQSSIDFTKWWMDIAAELGAGGVRYVPGESAPTAETIHLSAAAFRELADYAVSAGLQPASENYKLMTKEADHLLEIISLSERDYGLIADFGNAFGPNKYETLTKLMPLATSIHAWAEYNDNGALKVDDFQHCLQLAKNNGFDGPIMLLGGHPFDHYRQIHDLWSGVDELGQQVRAVFGEPS